MSAARPSIIAAREPRPGQAAEHARRDARHGRIAVVALAIGAPATVALVVVSLVIGAITDWFPAAARAASVTQPAGSSPLVKPWTPPPADSVVSWAGEARAGFQANTGDSVGGENFPAYQRVALIGRRMLESLTRAHMSQASAIEPAIRALGLTIDVERDPAQPTFLLLMVRNPYRLSAGSVGFFYWWQGDKLRYQGARFRPGCEVRMRVWWTAHAEAPYLCGIVERSRDREHTLSLMLLRMSPDAQYWDVVQFPGDGPDLSPGGVADWQDVNDDGVPELVAWLRAPSDSLFADCPGCPQLYAGRVFTLHATGFEVEDERPLSTLTATFQSFIRRLTDHHRAAALELVARGTLVDSAIAEGWGRYARAGVWQIETSGDTEPWPRWLAVRHLGPAARPRYAVHFTRKGDRWVISHWFRERYTGTDSTLRAIYGTPADDSVRAAKRKSQATGHPPKSASK